ncbi:DUF6559 family protein [Thalassotalea loyana]|uniref:DUF6559 family protein n=1 Tax=Thalassotalea loyana TaxID=280483 RepID=UPI002ADE4A4E|nr:DUF6559 family protein [Thalassotalea loyana]
MEDPVFLSNYRKKKAIKSYISTLGRDLARRYGKSKKYTSGQVETTIHDEGYNWRHICYAHALHTSKEQFDKWHSERGENCDFDEMREEISDNFFGGNISSIESGSFSDDSAGGSYSDSGGSD